MKLRLTILPILAVVLVLPSCGGGGGGGGSNSNNPAPVGAAKLDAYVYAPASRGTSTNNLLVSMVSGAPSGFAPLTNATVEAVSAGKTFTAKTDPKGHFGFSGLSQSTAKITVKPPAGTTYANWVGEMWPNSSSSSSTGIDVTIREIDASKYPAVRITATVFNRSTGNYEYFNNSQTRISIAGQVVSTTGWGVTSHENGPDTIDMYVLDNNLVMGQSRQVEVQVFIGQASGYAYADFRPLLFYPIEDPALYIPGSYGGRSFYYDNIHLGEDIKLGEGTPVRAIGNGKIVQYEDHSGYGELCAVIEHDLGQLHRVEFRLGDRKDTDFRYICSIYGHIRNCQARGGAQLPWETGDYVHAGDVIGYINDDDHNGDGPEHLHMGIRLGPHPGTWVYFGYDYHNNPDASVSHFVALSELIQQIQ